MIKKTTSSVGFVCNECGKSVVCEINFFERKNELIKVKCGCGKSELTLKIRNDNKVRLTVPCILCGTEHIYTLSMSIFFNKDVFPLTCSLLNVDICALGNTENMNIPMKKIFDEINKIFMMYANADEYYPAESKKPANTRKEGFKVHNPKTKEITEDNIMSFFNSLIADGDLGEVTLENDNWENLINDLSSYGDLNGKEDSDSDSGYINWDFDDDDDDDFDDFDDEVRHDDFTMRINKNISSTEGVTSAKGSITSEDGTPVKLEFKNRHNYERVLYVLTNLVKDDNIVCKCMDYPDISMILEYDNIRLICKKCNCSRRIKAVTSLDVEYINEEEELFLDDED